MGIESLSAEAAVPDLPVLSALLADAVESGASIGFLPPLAPGEADAYWRTVVAALREDTRVLLVARDAAGAVVGSAQLELAVRQNARHRAEVAKVMAHTQARRQGIGARSRRRRGAAGGRRSCSTRGAVITRSGSTRAWAGRSPA